MKTITRIGALGLVATLAGCAGDSTGIDALTPMLDQDVALQVADAAAQDVELMGGPGGMMGLGLAAGFDHDAPFRCGTHERGPITVVRTCTFKDAGGATQPAYDPATTASATIHVEIDGEIGRDGWSASVHRVRDLTVSGLAGAETTRTWNGTGRSTITRERHNDAGESREYTVTGDLTITNVVVPVPRADDKWPLSGTITHHLTVTIVGGPRDGTTRERTVTVTFNGTPLVQVTVNGKTFTVDLRDRRMRRDG